MFEINLLNCTLMKINITSYKSENKYYKIPQNLLKTIFNIKDENKIFNTSCTEISIMSECIGENSKFILSAAEAYIISEEQSLIKKTKMKDEVYKYEKVISEPQIPRHQDNYNRMRTFQLLQNNANNLIKKETQKENFSEKKLNINKNFGYNVNKTISKKISVSDVNSLRKSRMEHGILRDSTKKPSTKK